MCNSDELNEYFHNEDVDTDPPPAVLALRKNLYEDRRDGIIYDFIESFRLALDAGLCFDAIRDEVEFQTDRIHKKVFLVLSDMERARIKAALEAPPHFKHSGETMDKKELQERIKIVTAERDELSEQLEAVLAECEWLHQLLDGEAGDDA